VVPFVRVAPHEAGVPRNRPSDRADRPAAAPVVRRFPPGSEWLYAKLYSGSAGTDRLLLDVVRRVVAGCLEEGWADRWFFIRYADPHWHLRVRLHGTTEELWGRAAMLLREATAPFLDDGRLWRMQLDTYQPEVERYGGAEGLRWSEELFFVDSEAAISAMEPLSGDEGLDARWRLTLYGIDRLLDDLRLDVPVKLELARGQRRALAARLNVDASGTARIGSRFRELRGELDELLAPSTGPGEVAPEAVEALATRSTRLAPIVEGLLDAERAGLLTRSSQELASSYAHLHVNRMLRDDHDMQELVLFDFLERLYRSRIARRV
jgi:lantibiotic biosynthesis protein